MQRLLYFDNIIFTLQKSGGISVVWYELLSRILKESGISPVFIESLKSKNGFRELLNINEQSVIKDNPTFVSSMLPVNVSNNHPFIFHSSYYRYCNNPLAVNITTVHDFTYEFFRKGPAKWRHQFCKYRAIRNSQYIICISENTKRDLLHFLPDIDEKRIRVIYNGVSKDYCPIAKTKDIEGVPFNKGEFVVFVGSRMGYKNFDLLKRCITRTDFKLVIVGSKLTEKEKSELERYIPKERYCDMGFLPNNILNMVYNNAAALVYPSSYEGFGIPVLEAQSAGCPVIAYNSSSIPEIIGDTPLLMQELTESELISKLELLSNKSAMNDVVAKGVQNASLFSWDRMYSEYLNLYKEIWRGCSL